MLFKTDKVTVL